MFERFTDRARRVIFFARYEASHFGSEYVENHHLLLALFREDRDLMKRCVGSSAEVEKIREKLETQRPPARSFSTSVETPMSMEAKHSLACAAEEAERMGHLHIETGHVLLGLLRAHQSAAARILAEHGVETAGLREEIAHSHVGAAAAHSPLADPHHLRWPPPQPEHATPRYSCEDLERLAREVPEDRREAAARVLSALVDPVSSIAVAGSGGTFTFHFRGPLGATAQSRDRET